MFLITNILALQTLWGGCAALYFSSSHQRTDAPTISKVSSSILFVTALIVAAFLLKEQYNIWAVVFSIITMLMMNFVFITLIGAHENRALRLIAYGTLINFALSLIGGVYVA